MLRNTQLAAIVISASFVLSGSQSDAQIYGIGKDKKPQHTVKFPPNKSASKTGLTVANPRLNTVNSNGQDLRGYPDGLGRYGITQSNRFGTNIRHLFSGNPESAAQPAVTPEFAPEVPTPFRRPEPRRIGNTYVAPPSSSSFSNVSAKTDADNENLGPIKNPYFSVLKLND